MVRGHQGGDGGEMVKERQKLKRREGEETTTAAKLQQGEKGGRDQH